MNEPRLYKYPNGQIINVDVTTLQIALNKCRALAEQELMRASHEEVEGVLKEIAEVARRSIYDVGEYHQLNEVEMLVEKDGVE